MPLNQVGFDQARALAERFRGVSLAAVYSSPASRAQTTASFIAEPHALQVAAREDLVEMDLGELDGVRLGEMRDRFPDFFAQWTSNAGTARFPDGETLEETQGRAWGAVMQVVRDHPPDQAVVLVSHAFATYAILCRALGMPLAHYGRLRQDPAGVSSLAWRQGRSDDPTAGNFVLLASNQTDHLDSMAERSGT